MNVLPEYAGIHYGMIIVMGTETNMAARLMGKAEKGTVLVSERVYNSTKAFMSYDVTKPIELKGRNECSSL